MKEHLRMHSDVVNIANWEKIMDEKYPETSVLHWYHGKIDLCQVQNGEG